MAAAAAIRPVAPDATAQGRRFVARLILEWRSGANRFDKPGEAFRGVFHAGTPIAVAAST